MKRKPVIIGSGQYNYDIIKLREYPDGFIVGKRNPYVERTLLEEVGGTCGNVMCILCNFARTPLIVDGVEFVNTEQLFQMMKFMDRETLLNIYNARGMNIKYSAKTGEKNNLRRPDWGEIIVDCMKFCLQTKYEQSEEFRNTLKHTAGHIIVEDQTRRKTIKTVDTWGAVLFEGQYVGSNLLGRLLMELRDNGKLEYHLPDDIFDFISILKSSGQI